jgi:hypothetical protein
VEGEHSEGRVQKGAYALLAARVSSARAPKSVCTCSFVLVLVLVSVAALESVLVLHT